MRTTVIPAQITTIEDKIAGNLNLTQIILLLASLFIGTFIYATFPERLHFSWYKVVLIALEAITCVTLALRIKNRVVLNWIFILSSYYLRPRYYIFNKNDQYLRDIVLELPQVNTKKAEARAKQIEKENNEAKLKRLDVKDLALLKKLLQNPEANVSFVTNKNGGINATWQVKS